jgi:hypothetical protein
VAWRQAANILEPTRNIRQATTAKAEVGDVSEALPLNKDAVLAVQSAEVEVKPLTTQWLQIRLPGPPAPLVGPLYPERPPPLHRPDTNR